MHHHHQSMTNDEYHHAEGINKSQLDAINVSPLNYWDKYINPDREMQIEAHCLTIGSATHALILEPYLFKKKYAVGFDKENYPNALDTMDEMRAELIKRNLKISGSKKELMDRLILSGMQKTDFLSHLQDEYYQHIGNKTVLSALDYKNILAGLESLNKHHTAGALLQDALVEQAYFVEDEFGMTRKCKTDAITKNGQIWLDVKSTNDVSLNGFGRSAYKFRYLMQAAWYMDIARIYYGNDAPKLFAFIAIQKIRPYDVAVHFVTEDQLQLGRIAYERDYALLRECLSSNKWPGSDGGSVLELTLPSYALNNFRKEIDCDNLSY
jgi:hypothetical protein